MWRPTGAPGFFLDATGSTNPTGHTRRRLEILAQADSALDMGAGEGGVLAGLAPLPKLTVAYEGWWPTVPAAQATLRPLGAHLVVALGSADNVPRPGQ
jgi:hypothetical protein